MNSQGEPDPMDVILTKRLGPIQNRVSSLRTQIRQHEELLGKIKVPGGPTNFIDTTLRELNSFLDISFPQLDDEVRRKSISTYTLWISFHVTHLCKLCGVCQISVGNDLHKA